MNTLVRSWTFLLLFLVVRPSWSMDVYVEARPIQEVLPWLASEMGESLIISPEIQSVLTLSIQNASWEEVIEAVAQQPEIDLKWEGRVAILMPTRIDPRRAA